MSAYNTLFGVLVVPPEGDGSLLLTPGAGGSLPPVAFGPFQREGAFRSQWSIGWDTQMACEKGVWAEGGERALLLWWDGKLVPEGWDRMRRVGWDCLLWDYIDRWELNLHTPSAGELVVAAKRLTGGPGRNLLTGFHGKVASRIVLLDRVDDRLVERAQ